MTIDRAGGDAERGEWRAALYLADVVKHFDRCGLTVERAVVEVGRGGRIVFDRADPARWPGAWSPVLAGWDPSTGWDVLLAGPGSATRRVALCDGSVDPAPEELLATMRSVLDHDPRTADADDVDRLRPARSSRARGHRGSGRSVLSATPALG